MKPPVIALERVTFCYGETPILEDISLTIAPGEFLGVVGPNGGGKTTLLKLILGLLKPSAGTIRIGGEKPEAARRYMGYVPQYTEFARDFPISVEETVLMGRLGKTRSLLGYGRVDHDIAADAMREAEILELRRRPIGSLSGGQLQRVIVARALAVQPDILLLDEPTANIDMRVEEDIFDLMRKLNERMTIAVVSHDIGFISGYVTRVACLNRSLLCHHTDDIKGKHIEELYGTAVKMIHHHHHHGVGHDA